MPSGGGEDEAVLAGAAIARLANGLGDGETVPISQFETLVSAPKLPGPQLRGRHRYRPLRHRRTGSAAGGALVRIVRGAHAHHRDPAGLQPGRPAGNVGHYVGAGLLILTGLYVIWRARRKSSEEGPDGHEVLQTPQLLLTAAALSIDNLIVGFALGVHQVPILLAAGVIALVSVAMAVLGLQLGDRLGARFESLSEEIGGGVLILVGLALAVGIL